MHVPEHGGGETADQHGRDTGAGDHAGMAGGIGDAGCGWHDADLVAAFS
jgi:hypothetical protein